MKYFRPYFFLNIFIMFGFESFPLINPDDSTDSGIEQKDNGANDTAIYRDLDLRLVRNVHAKLDCGMLNRVIPKGFTIPRSVIHAQNCCWVNVWISTLATLGVELSIIDATDLMERIESAGSRMMSPLDTGDLVTRVDLPVTFVEYSLRDQIGWSIGTPSGPPVVFMNIGAHYQIWLPVKSELDRLFVVSHKSMKDKGRNLRTESVAIDQAMERAIADSIDCETRRLAQIELKREDGQDIDLAMKQAIDDSIEFETRRLAQLELERVERLDSDASMAYALSVQLNDPRV